MTHIDWDHDSSVVLRQQLATAIQGNEAGDIWIRQEGQHGANDHFVGVRRADVLGLIKSMLRAAGIHDVMVVPVDEIVILNSEGKTLRVPEDDFRKLDKIAEQMRLEEVAEQTPWTRPERRPAKDVTAADRKRRQRERQRSDSVPGKSRRGTVTAVTPRERAPAAPRLPAELDHLQHGGAKQPAG